MEQYDCLTSNNALTDYESVPLVLCRILPEVATQRNLFFAELSVLRKNLFQYAEDMYYEHVVLGCFYKPVPDEINRLLIANGAEACSDSPARLLVSMFSMSPLHIFMSSCISYSTETTATMSTMFSS